MSLRVTEVFVVFKVCVFVVFKVCVFVRCVSLRVTEKIVVCIV